jgi:diguanylate cyclase (GGDEF)-like protein/PAS domain S-box-containing protein
VSLTSPSPGLPPGAAWSARVHAALMPDYNRAATLYWWLMVLAGATLAVVCVVSLLDSAWQVWAEVGLGVLLAVGAGLFPIRLPGMKGAFAAGEIFLFLVLLVLGPAAAAVAAGAEALTGSMRTSKRWTSRIASPAIAVLAMASTGALLQSALDALQQAGVHSAAATLAAALVFSQLYFAVNSVLMSTVLRLKRNEPIFHWLALLSNLRWLGLSYAGSATLATLLFVTYREQGGAVLLVMVPLLAMLLVSLHLYFRQQEAGLALGQAHAELSARQAQATEREAQAAQGHLRQLQASEQRFHSAFTHAAIGMALLDFNGRVLQANSALGHLLGVAAPDLVGWLFDELVLDDDRAGLQAQLGLSGGAEFQAFATELRCRHADGSQVWLALHGGFFTEPGADTPCLILQAQDVSARRSAQAGLQQLAFHDNLTGLPNRRRFTECLDSAIARCKADAQHRFAVMFLDFDRFKLVNDSLGHGVGDQLLQRLARRLQENLRPGDILARLGGDEFVVLAERIETERDVIVVAERLMQSLKLPIDVGGVSITASASIGITFSSFGYASADEVLRDADTAMYKAKGEGKARWALFDASLHTAVADRLRLEGDLRQAIDAHELSVVFQPVFELANGRLTGFEALLRWAHPTQGLLGPAAFLPMAEETGLIRPLSDYVLHCACQQLRLWQMSQPAWSQLTMSVNVSAVDLAQPDFVARVGRAVVEAGLAPQHLSLELTENVLMAQVQGTAQKLQALRALGLRLAVDDFGTGQSSLSHLSRLPVDSLKIDRSFIHQLQWGSDDSAVVRAIVQLAASLRKVVVAEGIETAAQAAQLREMGCTYGQGFHLGTPLSAMDASALLQLRGRPG